MTNSTVPIRLVVSVDVKHHEEMGEEGDHMPIATRLSAPE